MGLLKTGKKRRTSHSNYWIMPTTWSNQARLLLNLYETLKVKLLRVYMASDKISPRNDNDSVSVILVFKTVNLIICFFKTLFYRVFLNQHKFGQYLLRRFPKMANLCLRLTVEFSNKWAKQLFDCHVVLLNACIFKYIKLLCTGSFGSTKLQMSCILFKSRDCLPSCQNNCMTCCVICEKAEVNQVLNTLWLYWLVDRQWARRIL